MCNIILNVIYASQLPMSEYCDKVWLYSGYAASYLNIVFGVCQASILTQLVIQLKTLFNYTEELVGGDLLNSEMTRNREEAYIKAIKRKQRCEISLFMFIILVLISCYIA